MKSKQRPRGVTNKRQVTADNKPRMEDYLVPQKLIVSALTPKNYSTWIQEIKGIATRAQVWKYVDPEGDEPEPVMPKYPKFGDYPQGISTRRH